MNKISYIIFVFLCIIWLYGLTLGIEIQALETEKQEYRQDLAKIQAMRKSLTPAWDKESFKEDSEKLLNQLNVQRDKNDLDAYKDFSDGILDKWKSKNPDYYGRLTVYLCGELSDSNFNDNQCYDLRRQYALSALQKSDEMSLENELDLVDSVTTFTDGPYAVKGEIVAQRRKKDIEVRLHAWRRLLDAIDPDWDPNEELTFYPTEIPRGVNQWASGMDPKAIKDPVVRAEYEAILEEHRKKIEKYNEQSSLRDWLKRYPKQAEDYIIRAYSTAPYNNEELIEYLNEYKLDETTKARIIDTVTKNIGQQDK